MWNVTAKVWSGVKRVHQGQVVECEEWKPGEDKASVSEGQDIKTALGQRPVLEEKPELTHNQHRESLWEKSSAEEEDARLR